MDQSTARPGHAHRMTTNAVGQGRCQQRPVPLVTVCHYGAKEGNK
jgi:hypothetical protein